jgi:hypothetical protein
VQFPFPLASDALADSPISRTVPLSPGVALQSLAALPPDPGTIGVYQLQAQPYSPRDLLNAYNLVPSVIKHESNTSLVGLVNIENRYYWSSFRVTPVGYALKLTLVSILPNLPTQPLQFDAGSSARAFLVAHHLCDGMQLDSTTRLTDGSTQVNFSEIASYLIVGAYARVTLSPTGVLTAVELRWVDTSVSSLVPGIPAATALAEVANGQGLVWIDGAIPGAPSSVTGVTILYVPVTEGADIYYEPVYQFTGRTPAGSTFYVYVPAIDRAYLG